MASEWATRKLSGKVESLSVLVKSLQGENRALRQNIEDLLKGSAPQPSPPRSSVHPHLSDSANHSVEDKGLNDRQLEKIVGISNQSLARYRLGQRSPTGEYALKLAHWMTDGKRWFPKNPPQ